MSFPDFLKIDMKEWTQQKLTLVYEVAVWAVRGVYGNGNIVILEAQSKVETFKYYSKLIDSHQNLTPTHISWILKVLCQTFIFYSIFIYLLRKQQI